MTTGMKTTARVKWRNGVFFATSSAIRYPDTMRIGVMYKVYFSVNPKDSQNLMVVVRFNKICKANPFFCL